MINTVCVFMTVCHIVWLAWVGIEIEKFSVSPPEPEKQYVWPNDALIGAIQNSQSAFLFGCSGNKCLLFENG